MMKTKLENNMTNCIGVVYVNIGTKLSWPIRNDLIYNEK